MDSRIAELEAEVEGKQEVIDELNAQIEEEEEQKKLARARVEELETEVQQLRSAAPGLVKDSGSTSTAATDLLEKTQKEIALLKKQLREKDEREREATVVEQSDTTDRAELEATIGELRQQLQNKAEALEESEEQLHDTKAQLIEANVAVAAAQAEAKAKAAADEPGDSSAHASADAIAVASAASQAAVATAEAAAREKDAELEELRERLEELQIDLSTARDELAQTKAQLRQREEDGKEAARQAAVELREAKEHVKVAADSEPLRDECNRLRERVRHLESIVYGADASGGGGRRRDQNSDSDAAQLDVATQVRRHMRSLHRQQQLLIAKHTQLLQKHADTELQVRKATATAAQKEDRVRYLSTGSRAMAMELWAQEERHRAQLVALRRQMQRALRSAANRLEQCASAAARAADVKWADRAAARRIRSRELSEQFNAALTRAGLESCGNGYASNEQDDEVGNSDSDDPELDLLGDLDILAKFMGHQQEQGRPQDAAAAKRQQETRQQQQQNPRAQAHDHGLSANPRENPVAVMHDSGAAVERAEGKPGRVPAPGDGASSDGSHVQHGQKESQNSQKARQGDQSCKSAPAKNDPATSPARRAAGFLSGLGSGVASGLSFFSGKPGSGDVQDV
eukprot:g241.t1